MQKQLCDGLATDRQSARCCRSVVVCAAITGIILASSGCGGLRITHRPVASNANPTTVPGIPFYPKRGRCRQEIVWFEPIYTLTLAALVPDKDGKLERRPRGTVMASRTEFRSQAVTDFIKLINRSPSDENTVMRQWRPIVDGADPKVLSRDFGELSAGDRILIGRSTAPTTYVDYSDQYYLNAKVPLAGSVNVDAKVADDGSLSEISSQTDNKTLETILGALPTSSVITGELGLAGKNIAPAGEIEAFELTVSISGYKHTLAKMANYPNDGTQCPLATTISLDEAREYKREEITTSADNTQAKKTDNPKPAPQAKAVGTKNNSATSDK